MKIFLIGLPGAGKTTLGTAFAQALQLPFYDLDELIEQQAGQSIPELFAQKGEEYFRQLEATALREFTNTQGSFVLATGGGTPCFHEGMAYMQESGNTVYLEVSFAELARRMSATERDQRPLMQGLAAQDQAAALEARFAYRLPTYRQAQVVVSGDALTPDDLLMAFAERRS
mgnify:CR=1 FL=1